MTGYITMSGISRRFAGATKAAVEKFDLEISEGESVVLLGPSGCGKTTCLRMLAGFERPDTGVISVGGKTLADHTTFVPPERRRMSVMFQNYALWPHMTVFDNVAYGPRTNKVPKGEVSRRVGDALALVGLDGFGPRYPHQLSGGQQQRVAMARALCVEPKIMLLDEPLSNLDTRLREEMRGQLKRLRRDLKITMVYVTHDQAEALSLADRIVVMHDGAIEQIGSPEEIYRRPKTEFVARSLGATNIIDGVFVGAHGGRTIVDIFGHHRLELQGQQVANGLAPGDSVRVSIRPIDLVLAPPEDGRAHVTVADSLFYGDSIQYELRTGSGGQLTALGPGLQPHQPGDILSISVDPANVALLDERTITQPMEEA